MSRRLDLVGQKFGKLRVLEFAGSDKRGQTLWVCRCDCDVESRVVVHGKDLRSGHTTSCGCYSKSLFAVVCKRGTHGDAVGRHRSKEYRAWLAMRERCYSPKRSGYERYGGRGIRVCDRWLHSFESFLADVGRAPDDSRKWSVDRIENDGNYDPGNVRWATKSEQRKNQSRNKERMAA